MHQECWVGLGLRSGLRRPKVHVCRGPKKIIVGSLYSFFNVRASYSKKFTTITLI